MFAHVLTLLLLSEVTLSYFIKYPLIKGIANLYLICTVFKRPVTHIFLPYIMFNRTYEPMIFLQYPPFNIQSTEFNLFKIPFYKANPNIQVKMGQSMHQAILA